MKRELQLEAVPRAAHGSALPPQVLQATHLLSQTAA